MVERRALIATALGALAAPALAQTYPDRPVRVIVPFAPGGNVDKIARMLAPIWAEKLRQPFVVENRAGAGGSLGAAVVAQARPDGHTLLAGSDGALLLDPARPGSVVDPRQVFATIGLMSRSHSAVLVSADSPLRSIADLVAHARARPRQVSAGHPGVGTAGQSAIRQLNRAAGIELLEVPYRGGAEALSDVLGGNIDTLFTELSTVLSLAQGGRGRVLAIASATRVAALPDAPRFADAGFPGILAGAFVGLVAPLATPSTVVDRLAVTLAESVSATGMAEEYARLAIEPPSTEQATPQGFAAFLGERLAVGL